MDLTAEMVFVAVMGIGLAVATLGAVFVMVFRDPGRTAHRGPAAWTLAVTILAWLAVTAVGLGWIAWQILVDPASHAADDATLALLLWTPQVLLGLAGLIVLVGLRGGSRWAPWLGMAWAVCEIVVAYLGATRLVGGLYAVASQGAVATWDPTDAALAITRDGATEFLRWQDFLAAALLVIAAIGLLASVALVVGSHRHQRVTPPVPA